MEKLTIGNTGSMTVKAPKAPSSAKKPAKQTGTDLRSGK